VGNPNEQQHSEEVLLRVLGPVVLCGFPLADSLAAKLLGVIGLASPHKVTVEELASAIWGDAPPRTWNSSLRTHLSVARKLLRAHKSGFEIRSDNHGFALVGDLQRVDAVRFRSLVTRARSQSEPELSRSLLAEALQLWRDGHGIERIANDLVELAYEAKVSLWSLQIEMGEIVEAAEQLRPLFRSNPSDQLIAELLVKALFELGSFEETLLIVDRHRQLMEQSGLEVSPVMQMLNRKTVSVMVAQTLQSLRARSIVPNALQRQQLQVNRSIGEVRPAGRVVVLVGQGGMGKSSALLQLAEQLLSEQVVVLFGLCESSMQPLQPIEEIVGPWRASFDSTVLRTEDLLFGLLEQRENGPIALIIDDAHLLDLATVKLLRRIILRGVPEHVVIIFACRPDEGSQPVRRLFAELRNSPQCEFHHLGNFTLDEIQAFVQLRRPDLRRADVWELSNQLFDAGSGMPLLTDLLLEANLDLDVARSSIGSHLEYEIDQLRPDHRRVLCVAALWGPQFDVSLVAESAGVTAALVMDSLEAGYKARLLDKRERRRTSFRDGSFRGGSFRHELSRSQMVASIGFEQKAVLHRRIAEVGIKRNLAVGVITEHLASALIDSRDPQDILDVLNRVRLLEADQHWDIAQRSLRLVGEAVGLQPWLNVDDVAFDVSFLSAIAVQAAGDWMHARALFSDAFKQARSLGRLDQMAAVAFLSYGSNQPLDGDLERANWLRCVYELAEPDSEYFVRAAAELVYLEAIHDLTDFGVDLVDVLRKFVATVPDERLRGFADHALLVVGIGSEHIEYRRAAAEQLLARRSSCEIEVIGPALLVLATTNLQLGNLEVASAHMDECRLLAATNGRAGDRWITHSWLAVLAEWNGETENADHHLAVALDLAEVHELPDGLLGWVVFVAGRAIRTGDWSMLLPATAPADRNFEAHPLDESCLALCLDAVSGCALFPESALDVAIQRVSESSRSVVWIPRVVSLAICATIRGGDAAERCIELLRPYQGTILFTPFLPAGCFGPADLMLAKLAARLGRVDDAASWFASSRALCERVGLVGWDPATC
jgi:DNA-binding SARP family transcriptional activator